jgi:FMN phosphatase YigB (HAD superfamily)
MGLTNSPSELLSHVCGFEKPAPEIYLLAAAAHACSPDECMFVDDVAANVDSARALGFHVHHFSTRGKRTTLERRVFPAIAEPANAIARPAG